MTFTTQTFHQGISVAPRKAFAIRAKQGRFNLVHWAIAICFSAITTTVTAGTPELGKQPERLTIANRGEIILKGDDVAFAAWQLPADVRLVQVVEYFPATLSASKYFEPLNDAMAEAFTERNPILVSTIVNLDAAMWGTSGMVMSELKSNKRKHPDATIVLDKTGSGATDWALGKKGAILLVLDKSGTVKYVSREAVTDADVPEIIALIKSLQ